MKSLPSTKSLPIAAISVWIFAVGLSFFWNIETLKRQTVSLAEGYANANLKKDLAFRLWSASHGGVYLRVDQNTKPSPYLANLPNRDVPIPGGGMLTLQNPAATLREIVGKQGELYGDIARITGLKYVNPVDAPDEWEKKALHIVDRTRKNYSEVTNIGGKRYLRMMQPMLMEPSCMKCHAWTGIPVGGLRGGTDIAIPLDHYEAAERASRRIIAQTHGGILLLGLAVIGFISRRSRQAARESVLYQEKLEESEKKFRMLFESANDGLILLDFDGNIRDINRTGHERLGYAKDEMVGKSVREFNAPEFVEKVPERFSEIVRNGRAIFESAHLRRDGTHVPIEINAKIVEIEGEQRIFSIVRDITERKRIEEDLRRESARNETLLRASGDGVHILDVDGNVVQSNDVFCKMLGYAPEEVLGMNVSQWDAKYTPGELRTRMRDLVTRSVTFETRHRRKDGSVLDVEVNAVGIEIGGRQLLYCASRDITQRKQLDESRRLASLIYQSSAEAIMVTDESNNILDVNPAFTRQTGYTLKEIRGRNPRMLQGGKHSRAFYREMWQAILEEGHWQGELWDRRKDGSLHIKLANISIIRKPDGTIYRHVAQFFDITDKKQKEELIWKQANYDTLTDLPNRRLFQDRLEQETRKAHRTGSSMALLFIDLDRFKEINDSLGHDKGDELLVEAARRLRSCVRETDTVARLGGDEFTVVLPEFGERAHLERIARSIIETLSRPFDLSGDVGYVSASIGISLYPDDAGDLSELMRHADQAMFSAKAEGRNRFSYFTHSMQMEAEEKLALTNDLRLALARNELEVYYQPIVDMASGRISKAEALLRWKHPLRGMVSPAVFIPLAEESGLIREIGDWVFQEAISSIENWLEKFGRIIQVSVNKSPIQFEKTENSPWMERLSRSALPGRSISVEITEGALIKDSARVSRALFEFRNRGIEVSIDDFGTGFSALSYLKLFDIDYLKIDKSFVNNLAESESDKALTEAIIVMAHKLGIKTIAEGVETEEQRIQLAAFGCDYMQGYLYSRPIPREEFEKLLALQS